MTGACGVALALTLAAGCTHRVVYEVREPSSPDAPVRCRVYDGDFTEVSKEIRKMEKRGWTPWLTGGEAGTFSSGKVAICFQKLPEKPPEPAAPVVATIEPPPEEGSADANASSKGTDAKDEASKGKSKDKKDASKKRGK